MTDDTSQSTGSENAQEAQVEEEPAVPVKPPASAQIHWGSEAWGQAARGASLFILLGMGFAVFCQLSFGGPWVHDFLSKNRIEMPERMMLIYQLIAGGGVACLTALVAIFRRDRSQERAALFEKWSWFLSPLMLLPAIPVVLNHKAWQGNHEDLLPIILFGALIAEVLVSHALHHVPETVKNVFATPSRKFDDDKSETQEESALGEAGGDDSRSAKSLETRSARSRENLTSSFASRSRSFWARHHVLLIVMFAALAYGAFMSFYTVRWHNKLGTAIFDLGINNNLLYGGLEGKFNQSPVIFPEDPQKYLANHVKIGLYTFLPIYAIFPRPETLLVIQSVSLGLGAVPLFLFARRRIPAWWAAALAACYLAYYPMHGANFYEMKLVPTAAAIVLASIWAIDAKRFWTGGIFFLWALIMREDVPVPLAVVGAVFLLSGHRPRAGLAMTVIASSWFIFLRFRFMNEVGSWWFPNMYEDLWAEPERGFQGVIKTLLSNPSYTLKHIFVEKKFWYLMHLLVPMAFIPVRRWWAWAALVPGAILTLLVTDYAPPTMFSFQYVMHWSPYLFIAASLVLASMRKVPEGTPRAAGALVAMCLASAALSYNYGAFSARDRALESGYHKIEFSFSEEEAKTLADVRALVASIPSSASVGATERVGAHLSSRSGFYTLRRGSHGVDYMVARKSALRLDRTKDTVRQGLKSGEYGVHARFGEFIVFKKGAPTTQNDDVLKEWKLSSSKKKKSKRKSRKSRADKSEEKKSDSAEDDSDDEDDSNDEDDSDDEDDEDQEDSEQSRQSGTE